MDVPGLVQGSGGRNSAPNRGLSLYVCNSWPRGPKAKRAPEQPVDHNLGLPCLNNGLLWAMVAYYFELLGVPGCW